MHVGVQLGRGCPFPCEFCDIIEDACDQFTGGLDFVTRRPRAELLRDNRRIIDESYEPAAYFGRVRRVGIALDCSQKRLKQPLRYGMRDMRAFARLVWRMGVRKSYRSEFWRKLVTLALRNPSGLRYSVASMALAGRCSGESLEVTRGDVRAKSMLVSLKAEQRRGWPPAAA